MFVGFHLMEQSLNEFLTESQNDGYNRNTNLYKYNNLKMYMDPKKCSTPHIIIRLGISEAIFAIKDWEKISGSLGSDERYLKRWIERTQEQFELQTLWMEVKKPKPVVMRADDTDFTEE